MSNEVVIIECLSSRGRDSIIGKVLTTQVLDIGELSAKLGDDTEVVRIISNGTGFWFLAGGSSASAEAGVGGNIVLASGGVIDLEVKRPDGLKNFEYIDTASLT